MDSSQSSTQVNKAKIEQYKIFKQRKDRERIPIANQYNTISFISSGTYGNVFKATKKNGHPKIYAIKKFKPDKEGEAALSSGISQSACREISLCREMKHENIVFLEQVILDPSDRSIAMVFDYAEHDLLQILQHHLQTERKGIPDYTVKSFLWQILNGVSYMHNNWVLHRDLKPANILVTTDGVVKIADLGLARLFQAPIYPLYHGDKVVVTIWYRAPELLLGSRHYTKGIDIWAIGCIYAELLMLKPLFKGDEAKMDAKKTIPFQKDQLTKIIDVLGFPTTDRWQEIEYMPEYEKLKTLKHNTQNNLKHLYQHQTYFPKVESGFNLLSMMLEYDPHKRISAENALKHPYFLEQPRPSQK
ncbi:cyclin-dependent protein kinase [Boothiomyces macroporosus]|uniref:Cyclin-dependent kinase 8 n=1 Tax=Boothiomyces macroporosus TaxID=261099 RepID=A0AAD5ULI9_9FUNG|nr:cyclin-dependent protein kinase [Boothiomyces macroporosus]